MASLSSAQRTPASATSMTRWWGFWLYAALSAFHVGAIILSHLHPGDDALVYPSKLLLMPALAFAASWALRGTAWSAAATVLLLAIGFSWLGDGAGFFFPFTDKLPPMLACFGIAHLLYIWLFVRPVARRPVPMWSVIYGTWWIVMVLVLWPHLGVLAVAVAAYGLVLGGTAVVSTRGSAITAVGGVFFLASDSILAVRLFLEDALPAQLSGPGVMTTYTLGQGLLVFGIVRLLRRRAA